MSDRLRSSSSSVMPILRRDLRVRRRAHERPLELDDRPLDLTRASADGTRHPVERAELVDDRALDPRDRVGLELDLAVGVESLDRPDQAEQPVGHEILLVDVGRKAGPETTGDELHERRVGEDQAIAHTAIPRRAVLLPERQRVSPRAGGAHALCEPLCGSWFAAATGGGYAVGRPIHLRAGQVRRARSPIHSASAPAASAITQARPPADADHTAVRASATAIVEKRSASARRCTPPA